MSDKSSANKTLYDKADNTIRRMNRFNLKLFGKLKLAKFDELHLVREVADVYDKSARMADAQFMALGLGACAAALMECGKPSATARRMAQGIIIDEWLEDLEDEVNDVTMYRFTTEQERKQQRLIEALLVALNTSAEIDRALKQWSQQLGQYADLAVDNARLAAFRAAGIRKVRWNTEQDDRVCEDCDELEGLIFPIDQVPPKQHWHCRCWLTPVRG